MDQPTLPLAEMVCLTTLPSIAVCDHRQLPREGGIYFVLDADSAVRYIGRTINLHVRWQNHHRLSQYCTPAQYRIAWLTVSNPSLLPAIEQACLDYFQPRDNRRGMGIPVAVQALINFQVTVEERKQLRILLMREGLTLQDFFAHIVRQKLAQDDARSSSPVAVEGN